MADPHPDDKKEFPTLKRGKWVPLSVILGVPFVFVLIPLYRAARYELNLKAMLAVVAIFEVMMFAAEYFSLSRGHWIWNESRILGPKIWGVPIEEPLLYYWLGPTFIILMMLALRRHFVKKT